MTCSPPWYESCLTHLSLTLIVWFLCSTAASQFPFSSPYLACQMSHSPLPSLLTPHQESNPQIPMDSLSRGSSLNCWAHGNWSFISAHRRKTLSFVFCVQEQKLGTPGWTTGTPLSPCAQQWEEHHRGDWEIWLNNPLLLAFCVSGDSKALSTILVLTSSDVNFLRHRWTVPTICWLIQTTLSFSPQLNRWHCNHGAMRSHLEFEEGTILLWTSTTTQEKHKWEESERWQKRWTHSLDAFDFLHKMGSS